MSHAKIEEIFHAVLERGSAQEREDCLAELCGDDRPLRMDVTALLQSYEKAGGFLEHSPELKKEPDAERTQSAETAQQHAFAQINQFPFPFGDYELLEKIAEGGMGVIYKARQVGLDRIVALKMILSGQFAGEESIHRFYLEAESAGGLDHPGIVPVYEVGCYQGQHFFSMAIVKGENLIPRIQARDMGFREAARLVKNIAVAVQAAHHQGIVHRDLKPGNILLNEQREPRITDFGLAKKISGGSDMTATGVVMGTPNYMSPEQAAGKEVSSATDIYSIGSVLFALVTGRPPFEAGSQIETMIKLLHEQPPRLRRINRAVPRDLEAICLKCLEKEPADRYSSAGELAKDLQRFLSGEPAQAKNDLARRVRKWTLREPALAAHVGATVFMISILVFNYLWFGGGFANHRQMMWSNIGFLTVWALTVWMLQKFQNKWHTRSVFYYLWAIINPVFLTAILSQNSSPRGSLLSLYLLLIVTTCFYRRVELVVVATLTSLIGYFVLIQFYFSEAELVSKGYLLVSGVTVFVTGVLLSLLTLRISRLGKQNTV